MKKEKNYIEKKLFEKTYLKIEAKYCLGGMNYFSGKVEKRGYELIFLVIEKDDNNTVIHLSQSEHAGYKQMRILVEEAKRYSEKRFLKFKEKFLTKNLLKLFYEKKYDEIKKELKGVKK